MFLIKSNRFFAPFHYTRLSESLLFIHENVKMYLLFWFDIAGIRFWMLKCKTVVLFKMGAYRTLPVQILSSPKIYFLYIVNVSQTVAVVLLSNNIVSRRRR